mmetsp:Transcript_16509/g.44715  ORF Transcript_16509/g.44715 Transcript_16509/m.44715 type:complete len:82 (+) Transcript_16509:47-292(+)
MCPRTTDLRPAQQFHWALIGFSPYKHFIFASTARSNDTPALPPESKEWRAPPHDQPRAPPNPRRALCKGAGVVKNTGIGSR